MTIKATSSVIVITVVHGTLTHYYVARAGENNIYMFTYKTDTTVTMTRYIVRVKPGLLKFTPCGSASLPVTSAGARR